MFAEKRPTETVEIRVRGCVQGVGFRPTVWRIARRLGLAGEVYNDSEGVVVIVGGASNDIADFITRLRCEAPPLSRIDTIETRPFTGETTQGFRIADSLRGGADTQIAPDAAICAACADEVVDPSSRRYRYAFTNCTHCGPRLTIVHGVPYDRTMTTMAPFAMCEECAREYADPGDRRFHAQPIACPVCGPRLSLATLENGSFDLVGAQDALAAAARLIGAGEILAIKGLGGYQLACDATNETAVNHLRHRKRRDAKPFALMAEDLAMVRNYCRLSEEEAELLSSPSAPIVLLEVKGPLRLPRAVAPGLNTLGFMLPTTPLHLLLVRAVSRPVIMTSGNWSDEPQVIDDAEVPRRLGAIASHVLTHNRRIATRVDDSLVRVMDEAPRVLRRARGSAPTPIRMPSGFRQAPPVLAFGGHLKATFCLLKKGEAILSQHQGDLEDAATLDDYQRNQKLFAKLFEHSPEALVVDRHPQYATSRLARTYSGANLPLIEAQHHHAHVAACLAENGYPLDASPVLGIVLDGVGLGDDGGIWGGEFLLADYRDYRRLGSLKPAPMLGGEQAAREPWRNLYAQIAMAMGWRAFAADYRELEVYNFLDAKPRETLDAMMNRGINAPLASSCGRLFDAFAALLGLCRDRQAYEGQAGALVEAAASGGPVREAGPGYAFKIVSSATGLAQIEPAPMWRAALQDCCSGVLPGLMAARFHKGLAEAVAELAARLRESHARLFDTVALSGGCFQNRILFEEIARRLRGAGFAVLSHAQVPTNDGGLSLGQAAIGGALLIRQG
ncbi:carbamoyltransferase HypF [Methylocystis parvus]|uniref:Carbamoyltransferase HypF n=1 Tax=Methylocystis parvus TaxID=134 RepID=A0A6B8MG77_9HYPH|nr:carbamoyltransferase HypF [Methylocystis parvus]QGN00164.1 carbamoyltransferase HypF [Methylocystis parvus]WBK02528.1 carbamoyltransferase HypF [Methylocystis parvus OBBP]